MTPTPRLRYPPYVFIVFVIVSVSGHGFLDKPPWLFSAFVSTTITHSSIHLSACMHYRTLHVFPRTDHTPPARFYHTVIHFMHPTRCIYAYIRAGHTD
jgi:hypothetical protein